MGLKVQCVSYLTYKERQNNISWLLKVIFVIFKQYFPNFQMKVFCLNFVKVQKYIEINK